MQLFVRRDGRKIALTVQPRDEIWEVKKLIEQKENIPHTEQELTYNENILLNDQSLSHYNIRDQSTLNVRHNPHLSYTNESISVSNYFNRTSAVNVSSSDTIEQVRAKLRANKELSVVNQPLSFAGRTLKDGQTLSYYSILAGSTLRLEPALRGDGFMAGIEFTDVSNASGLKKVEWAKSAPRWLYTMPGLCLEGICSNTACEANGKKVIMPIGYAKFDLILDSDGSTSKCPVCSNYVEPQSCAFNNCWWRWSGKKQVTRGAAPITCSGDWKHADDAYHYFDQKESGTVTWRQLLFEAVKDKPIN